MLRPEAIADTILSFATTIGIATLARFPHRMSNAAATRRGHPGLHLVFPGFGSRYCGVSPGSFAVYFCDHSVRRAISNVFSFVQPRCNGLLSRYRPHAKHQDSVSGGRLASEPRTAPHRARTGRPRCRGGGRRPLPSRWSITDCSPKLLRQ